jgi:hypothetical protein
MCEQASPLILFFLQRALMSEADVTLAWIEIYGLIASKARRML